VKIIIAPQAFKGCASAQRIALAIAEGVRRVVPQAILSIVPVADGGDDTLDILLDTLSGTRHETMAGDAWGKQKPVIWGSFIDPIPTAVIDMARICGMAQLSIAQRNPCLTTTYGVGEVIRAVLDQGFRRMVLALGGSATNDAGAGLVQALGVRLLDAQGNELPRGGAALAQLHTINVSDLDARIAECQIMAACDVTNPLLGVHGATAVYAPQKGADAQMAQRLECAVAHFNELILQQCGMDLSSLPYGGAAGGAAAGIHFFLKAKLVSGAQWVLNEIQFEKYLADADLVITAEGCLDYQTINQKIPWVVAQVAKKRNIPVVAIVGALGPGHELLLQQGFDAIYSVSEKPLLTPPPNSLVLLANKAEAAMQCICKK